MKDENDTQTLDGIDPGHLTAAEYNRVRFMSPVNICSWLEETPEPPQGHELRALLLNLAHMLLGAEVSNEIAHKHRIDTEKQFGIQSRVTADLVENLGARLERLEDALRDALEAPDKSAH